MIEDDVALPEREGASHAEERAYFEALQELWQTMRGAPLLLSADDVQRALDWFRQGVPLAVARAAVEEVYRKASAKKGRRTPMTLRYCEHAVLDAFAAWREGRVGSRRHTAEEPPELPGLLEEAARAVDQSLAPEPVRRAAAAALRALAAGAPVEPGCDPAGGWDQQLVAACLEALPPIEREALESAALQDIARHAGAMSDEVRARALASARARRVRQLGRLPDLTLLPLIY